MSNSRERRLCDGSSWNARAGKVLTRVVVLLVPAFTSVVLFRCSGDSDPRLAGIYDWPAQEDYDIFPIDRAVAALASVGMELDAESVRCERVALEDANESGANLVGEVLSEEQLRLRSRINQSLDLVMWKLRQSSESSSSPRTPYLAFFDSRSKKVYAVENYFEPKGWDEDEFRYFMALHEFTHVWRDQQTPIFPLIQTCTETTEGWHIARFMLEGEAQFAAAHLVNHDARSVTFPADQWSTLDVSAHGFVYRSADVPYISGARRASEIFEAGGWPALFQAFDHPPASSEQAMHPEKREDAPQLPLDRIEPDKEGGYRLIVEDCLGELGFLELFERGSLPSVRDRIAAAGWDGDLVSLVKLSGGEEVLFGRSVWDRETDAQQVADRLKWNSSAALRRSGCVIDWTSGDKALLESEAFANWARRTDHWRRQPEDAASTEQVEARIVAEAAAVSYNGYNFEHLSFPALAVRIELPRGWLSMGEHGSIAVPLPGNDFRCVMVESVIEPPLPELSVEQSRQRLQQRISVHDPGDASTRVFEMRQVDDIEVVISSSQSKNGIEHRSLALPTSAGLLLLQLDAWATTELDLDKAWDTLIQQIRTGVIDQRTWNERLGRFEEPNPDLESPR